MVSADTAYLSIVGKSMIWNLRSNVEKKRFTKLLNLFLLSWLCMGLLLGAYFESLVHHFCWLLWLGFVASASGTIMVGMDRKSSLYQFNYNTDSEMTKEVRELQKNI